MILNTLCKKSIPISHKEQGFTLLEVLFALLILSVGLLPMLGMQMTALHKTQEAYLDSLAATQLNAMLERLRVNRSDQAREQELEHWNQINAALLPLGHGTYHCDLKSCIVRLQWHSQTASYLVLHG